MQAHTAISHSRAMFTHNAFAHIFEHDGDSRKLLHVAHCTTISPTMPCHMMRHVGCTLPNATISMRAALSNCQHTPRIEPSIQQSMHATYHTQHTSTPDQHIQRLVAHAYCIALTIYMYIANEACHAFELCYAHNYAWFHTQHTCTHRNATIVRQHHDCTHDATCNDSHVNNMHHNNAMAQPHFLSLHTELLATPHTRQTSLCMRLPSSPINM